MIKMSKPVPKVSVATSADVQLAAHTIVKAFTRDPFNVYLYNNMADQDHPPWGTEEMMALRIAYTMTTELVFVAHDGEDRCAGVALWAPPQPEPLGWGQWAAQTVTSVQARFACLYYGSRGMNRKVVFSGLGS
jgi:hypothetical protein